MLLTRLGCVVPSAVHYSDSKYQPLDIAIGQPRFESGTVGEYSLTYISHLFAHGCSLTIKAHPPSFLPLFSGRS